MHGVGHFQYLIRLASLTTSRSNVETTQSSSQSRFLIVIGEELLNGSRLLYATNAKMVRIFESGVCQTILYLYDDNNTTAAPLSFATVQISVKVRFRVTILIILQFHFRSYLAPEKAVHNLHVCAEVLKVASYCERLWSRL